jgi:signal transduction histidine kinase
MRRGLAERLYERFGPRTFIVCVVVAAFEALVFAVVISAALARYVHWSASNVVVFSAEWFPIVLGVGLVFFFYNSDAIRTIVAWKGHGRTVAAAPATLRALADAPRLIIRACAVATLAAVFALADLVYRAHVSAWGIAPVLIFALLMGPAAATCAIIASTDRLLRPMVADVITHVGLDSEIPPGGLGLRTRVLAPLPILAVFGMLAVGAWANAASTGLLRLTLTLAISAASLLVAGLVSAMALGAVLDPVRELIAATERVRAGDLETQVPITGTDELASLTASFNQMLAGLRERERLDVELRASRERIVSSGDAARRRLERDLHDGAQQHLVLLGLKLGMAKRLIRSDPAAAETLHDELRGDLDMALAELRQLAHGIYPASLSNDGLARALQEAVDRSAIEASVTCDGVGRYRPEIEGAVYFTCVEALQNAAKHAGEGARATVRLAQRNGSLEFSVSDDGAGFDPAVAGRSAGLQNMTDRIGALGGTVAVDSAPGAGTRVVGAVPLSLLR